MSKLLSWTEANEVIQTLRESYGLTTAKAVILPHRDSDYFTVTVKAANIVYHSIFGIKWTTIKWIYFLNAPNLEDAVIRVEQELMKLDGRVELADKIRDRHAQRLINEKLEEE